MKGTNRLLINRQTLCEALQLYVHSQFAQPAPIVVDVQCLDAAGTEYVVQLAAEQPPPTCHMCGQVQEPRVCDGCLEEGEVKLPRDSWLNKLRRRERVRDSQELLPVEL